MARSNSAKAPTTYIIMRPAGVVVSIFSVIEPAAARRTCRGWGMQPGSGEYIHCRTVCSKTLQTARSLLRSRRT
jgi:hypothetical protein